MCMYHLKIFYYISKFYLLYYHSLIVFFRKGATRIWRAQPVRTPLPENKKTLSANIIQSTALKTPPNGTNFRQFVHHHHLIKNTRITHLCDRLTSGVYRQLEIREKKQIQKDNKTLKHQQWEAATTINHNTSRGLPPNADVSPTLWAYYNNLITITTNILHHFILSFNHHHTKIPSPTLQIIRE